MAEGGYDPNDQLPSVGETPQAVRTDESVVPLTAKQILGCQVDSDHTEVYVDNQPRKEVCIVGRIAGYEERSVSVVYEIEDGTGTVSVEMYNYEDSVTITPVNTYVYVVGKFSTKNPQKIEGFVIKPITDFNQVCYHMMQALFVHLFQTRGLPPNSAYSAAERDAKGSQPKREEGGADAEKRVSDAIVEFIKAKGQDGATKREIIAQFSNATWSVEQICTIIEKLVYVPAIYEPNDDVYVAL